VFTGMVVMTMTAVDYDDPAEGTNAKLIYSIEKNVIEEETGTPIFEIESDTGVIKTAVCCLDRERTPDYSIQVVAMDGGGLKGIRPGLNSYALIKSRINSMLLMRTCRRLIFYTTIIFTQVRAPLLSE